MTTITKSKSNKLKIIPGRGLTGRDIKNRLRNRTLEGQTFGNEHYTLDESMDKFTKMSKVEQIAAVKENNAAIQKIQRQLDEVTNKQEQRQKEQEIERRVQEKMKEIAKQELENQNQNKQ